VHTGVAVCTVLSTHTDPIEAIAIQVAEVRAVAVLINAIVGDLLRSRERRRVPVIAVDKRGEAVTVHICGRAIVCICVRIVSRIVPVRRSTV
jgi:hypothetical protein